MRNKCVISSILSLSHSSSLFFFFAYSHQFPSLSFTLTLSITFCQSLPLFFSFSFFLLFCLLFFLLFFYTFPFLSLTSLSLFSILPPLLITPQVTLPLSPLITILNGQSPTPLSHPIPSHHFLILLSFFIWRCEKIVGHGINCFINRQLIYNFPEQVQYIYLLGLIEFDLFSLIYLCIYAFQPVCLSLCLFSWLPGWLIIFLSVWLFVCLLCSLDHLLFDCQVTNFLSFFRLHHCLTSLAISNKILTLFISSFKIFTEAGVVSIEHADFDGIERLAAVTGGEIASTFDRPDLSTLGECKLIDEIMVSTVDGSTCWCGFILHYLRTILQNPYTHLLLYYFYIIDSNNFIYLFSYCFFTFFYLFAAT